DGFEFGADAFEFRLQGSGVDIGCDGLDFDVRVGALCGTTAGDRDHFFDFLFVHEPVGDVHHHISDSDDGYTVSDLEIAPAEFRQAVEVVDQVLCVIDAGRAVAGDSQCLCPLCADGDDDGGWFQNRAQLFEREVALCADLKMSQIMYAWISQDHAELFSHALFQFVLVEIDAVFDQASGFDVAIDENDFMAGFGQFAHAIDAGRACADGDDKMSAGIGYFAHCLVVEFLLRPNVDFSRG